jgi:Family of unknown function (DUF5706)
MDQSDTERLGSAGAPHPGSPRDAASVAPGHLDLSAAEHAEVQAGELDPEALQWAQSLLEVARFELARADDKANTMFRFYGVVAALSIGLLAGGGWSPTDLSLAAEVLFWAGVAALLASGVFLGRTLYPRRDQGTPPERLLYFGHVLAYPTVPELITALRSVPEDLEHRLAEQLLMVSRLVNAKYGLMRWALASLGVGTGLCIAAVLVSSVAS